MKKIFLIIICLLLTGCYNYKEINNLAIVSSLAINFKDNNFEVIIEIGENNKDDKYSSYILKGIGTSIESAIKNASTSLNKDLYFINLDVLLISSDAANLKLNKILDFIARDNNFSFDYNIAICDKSEEVIQTLINQEKIFGNYIKSVYDNTNNNLINIKICNLLDIYLNNYQDIILPIFDIQNESIIMNRAAIFNKTDIVNYIEGEEIAIYNILNNNFMNYYLNFNFDDKKTVLKGNNYLSKIIYQNNTIKIFTRLEGNLIETENFDINNKEHLKIINNEFKKRIDNFIIKLYSNNSDILGFRNIIYKQNKYPDNLLNKINYQIKTKIIINDYSLILDNIGD
ncbi:MAG: Ger(x)C family spore germination C-terminal domain-containing protein [Bacilli bacterium]|nr:Ger(x)C family spore germination C-terminal domain-containing protein [Bacilli bacterium]MDD4406888.1 Ger(x)C family spore germination C-terminal domain-containing protein [Bacilli bacterium]